MDGNTRNIYEEALTKKENPIHKTLKHVLAPIGFSRKGNSWFRRGTDVVQVVNLQKSQYGQKYYINFAVWLLALGETQFPREEQCHIRFRVDSLVTNEDQYQELLDLESNLNIDNRDDLLRQTLTSSLQPFIDTTFTTQGIRRLFVEGALRSGMVHVHAKRMLTS
jgi:hypothetical protein